MDFQEDRDNSAASRSGAEHDAADGRPSPTPGYDAAGYHEAMRGRSYAGMTAIEARAIRSALDRLPARKLPALAPPAQIPDPPAAAPCLSPGEFFLIKLINRLTAERRLITLTVLRRRGAADAEGGLARLIAKGYLKRGGGPRRPLWKIAIPRDRWVRP